MKPLAGKVALVTGASGGLGRAIAEELAEHGAAVAVHYRNNADAAAVVVRYIEALGVAARSFAADVGVAAEARVLAGRVVDAFGRIDILVNNAGISRDRTVRRMTVAQWDEVVRVNLSSVFYVTSGVLEGMIERRWGRIVNMSSVLGRAGAFGQANYAASKAGIVGFTKSLALEVARYGITVNALCPGYVKTELNAGLGEEQWAELLKRIPLGTLGTPRQVAAAARFLVVEGEWITGQVIDVNGGMYM